MIFIFATLISNDYQSGDEEITYSKYFQLADTWVLNMANIYLDLDLLGAGWNHLWIRGPTITCKSEMDFCTLNQPWTKHGELGKPETKWRFIAKKIIKPNGDAPAMFDCQRVCASNPWHITSPITTGNTSIPWETGIQLKENMGKWKTTLLLILAEIRGSAVSPASFEKWSVHRPCCQTQVLFSSLPANNSGDVDPLLKSMLWSMLVPPIVAASTTCYIYSIYHIYNYICDML